jgi:poly [ADP-ribose] polymerase
LLWHGSRFSNFVGILTNGMRIAPPEAPKTGYNFGKGVYFADLAGKSANYCCTHLSKGVGVFAVCEVALGKPRQFLGPDHDADILPKGIHSTHAVGSRYPNPSQSIYMNKDIEVPMGKLETNNKNCMGANEWVVYNTNQIKISYLV